MMNRYMYNDPRYGAPVSVPTRRSYINPLNGRKSMSFQQMIGRAERSVDTISSLIPLYKKVKPVIDQGKTMLTSVTSFFSQKPKGKTQVEHVEAEVVETEEKKETAPEREERNFDYRVNQDQSKPFFI